jgi:hypothetical protein
MKTTLLLFILSWLSVFQSPLNDLTGIWKLERVETNKGTILPKHEDYFLTISKDLIKYNLDVNTCYSNSFTIDNEKITLDKGSGACTKICCDGRYDTIIFYLNYSGTYKLQDSLLIISNGKGKLYLKRE